MRALVCLALSALWIGLAAPVEASTRSGASARVTGAITTLARVSSTPAADYARQARKVTNRQRVANDLAKFSRTQCVQRYARKHAKAMAETNSMYHQELGPVMRTCGLNAAGENVAYGYASGRSVVKDGWMMSRGHRANILHPRFDLMGLAAREGSDGRWYAVQVFGRAN